MENLRHLLCGIYCSPLVAHAKPSNRTEPVKQNNFGLKAGQSAVAISTESCLRLWGTCFVAPRTVPAKSASADTFLALNTGEAAHARANYARRAYPSRNPVSFCESQHDALLPLQVVVSDSDEWKGHRLPLFSATNDSTVASANYYPHLVRYLATTCEVGDACPWCVCARNGVWSGRRLLCSAQQLLCPSN